MGVSRRRQRSARMSVAAGLLGAATAVVASSLGTGWMLGGAAVVALGCGVVAARIISNELAESRRVAAREHAQQAISYQRLMARTAADHAQFTAAMTGRLRHQEQVVTRVRRALRIALRRADDAHERARTESRRSAAMAARLAELEELIAQPASGSTVVELVGWEQRTSDTAPATAAHTRRHA